MRKQDKKKAGETKRAADKKRNEKNADSGRKRRELQEKIAVIAFLLAAAAVLVITALPELRGFLGNENTSKQVSEAGRADSALESEFSEGGASVAEESSNAANASGNSHAESGSEGENAGEEAPEKNEPAVGEAVTGLFGTFAIVSATDGRVSLCIGRDPQWYEEPEAVVFTADYLTEADTDFLFTLVPTEQEGLYRIFSAGEGGTRCLTWNPEKGAFVLRESAEEENQYFQLIYAGEDCYLIQTAGGEMLGIDIDWAKESASEEDSGKEQSLFISITEGQPVTAKSYDAYTASEYETWMLRTPETGSREETEKEDESEEDASEEDTGESEAYSSAVDGEAE